MKYHVLAVDYDGTLATDGVVEEVTLSALHRLRESGRRIILVTGRILEELLQLFPQISLCDLVVADNGGLLYDPETNDRQMLAEPPSRDLIEELVRRGVPRMEIGDVVVATWRPHETTVLQTIRDLGLELQIIFNKGAVMILPSGVNKASGLRAALQQLGLSHHNVVGVGDAENDEAFLSLCDASVAVDNALDIVKRQVDLVVRGARGAGVVEVIERLLDNDLQELHPRPNRGILIGTDLSGADLRVPVYGTRMLVTGGPAGGKSNFAIRILEQLIDQEYQACVIDPEGDYLDTKRAVVLGTIERTSTVEDVIQVLKVPSQTCVISLFATPHGEQPVLFAHLLRGLMEHRSQTGRPHWVLIDEAHYPLTAKWGPVVDLHLDELRGVMFITAFIDRLPATLLHSVDLFVAIGDRPAKHLAEYCALLGQAVPTLPAPPESTHRAIAWWRREGAANWFERLTSEENHHRHRHGYLDGNMDPEHRFYFRGPNGALNLCAQNLRLFMQLGEGVDDETWLFHLRKGDYSCWFRDVIKDDKLATLADQVARDNELPAAESRQAIFDFIHNKYHKYRLREPAD